MLTPSMAEQRRQPAYLEREARAAKRKKKKLTRPATRSPARPNVDDTLEEPPAYLPLAGPADMVFEPLYITASPTGFAAPLTSPDDLLAQPTWTPTTANHSALSPTGLDAPFGGKVSPYATGRMDSAFGQPSLPMASEPDPTSRSGPVTKPDKAPPPTKAPAPEEKGGKDKSATAPKDKGLPTDEQPKAEEKAKATPDGQPGAKGKALRADQEGALRKEEPPPPPLIIRPPKTGDHHLDRPSFSVPVEDSGFNLSRDLDVRRPHQPAKASQGGSAAQAEADFRPVYREAVDEGYGLYRRLMAEAAQIAGDAERRNRELEVFHQQGLSDALSTLDGALVDSRNRLAAGTAQLHLDVLVGADKLRARIWSAAEGALDKLAKRLEVYEQAMSGPRARRLAIQGQADESQKKLETSAKDAKESLKTFKGNVAAQIPLAMDPVGIATRDAQIAFAPGHIALASDTVEEMRGAFAKLLTESFKCLPCEFDRAFQSLDKQVDGLRTAGPKAVRAARDGALVSVDQAVAKLDEAIDASRDATDQALIAQHDRTRESLIDLSQTNSEREAKGIEEAAGRQCQALTGMAAGQPKAIEQVRGVIVAQADSPPAQFAQLVIRSASRLKANLKGIGDRQPKASRESAAKLGASHLGRARLFAERQENVIRGTRDGLFEVVRMSVDGLSKQILDTMLSMDEMPDKVGASCNAHLAPAGEALTTSVQALNDGVEGAAAVVNQTLNGGEAVAKHAEKVKTRKEAEAKAKSAKEAKEKASGKATKKKDEKKAEEGKPLPAPASCTVCDAEAAKREKEKKSDPVGQPATPDSKGPNTQAKEGGGKTESKGPEEGGEDTPNAFIALCDKIKADPKKAPQVASFLKSAEEKVPKELARRVGEIKSAVSTTFAPHVGMLFAALRGLSANQGTAIRHLYNSNYSPNLDEKIRRKFLCDSVWSAGSTDRANYRSAIALLNGNTTEGAMSELVAAFNYSNENQRIRDILLSLSPKQLEELEKSHKKELDELAEQLDGDDLIIFQQLRKQNTGPSKANSLREGIDTINEKQEGEKRGDAVAEKITHASVNFRDALEGDKERPEPDIFGLEAPTKEVKERNEGHWKNLKTAFVELEGVKSEIGNVSDPDQAMFTYATRKVRQTHDEPDPYGEGMITVVTYDEVNDYHKAWIGAIISKGADSPEAKGARLLVEERRAKPDLKGLDAAMHTGKADAVEGGGYDEKAAKKGIKDAEEERIKILEASEKARVAIQGGTAEKDPEKIKKRISTSIEMKLILDPTAKAVAAGIMKSDEGDPVAVITHAIEKKKTDLALIQLKRMNRVQIEAMVKKYNEDNPGGPSLFARLGIFTDYGKSGAVFEGDEANELEMAFMAVPQNDKERAEVALRVMKQTMDQSGRLGRSVCAEEYKALIRNAAALKEAAGVTDADIDDFGRIRSKDAAGNSIIIGNFDAKGNFVLPIGGRATPFETAIAMAKVTSTAYTQAVDRASSLISTILIVLAAAITTALTFGAGASIWLPVLVTLAAGGLGMLITAGMKGGRYTRSEMLRDAVMTIAQAATAGLGAAVGAGLRGGAGAMRAAATSLKVSETTLKAAAGPAGLKALTALQEVAIGAGSGAFMGGVGAAVDPANRRSDNYVAGIFHGILRGGFSGGVGAGVTRGVTSGLTGLARGMGARSGAAFVLGRGGSLELAARVAAMRAKAFSTSAFTTIGIRSAAQGISGVASVTTEMAYERGIQGKDISAAQAFDRIADAFWQNAIQGMLEGAAERGMTKISRKAAAYHAQSILDQQPLFDAAARSAVIKEGVKRGLLPPSADRPPPSAAPTVPATTVRTEEPIPAARPTMAVDEQGAVMPARRPDEAEAPRPVLAGEEPLRAANDTIVPAGRAVEEGAAPRRAALPDEAEAAARRPVRPDEEEPAVLRTALRPSDDQPTLRSARDDDPEKTNPNIRIPETISEFPNGIDLKPGMLEKMAFILPETPVRPTNPRDARQARENYDLLRTFRPDMEVLLAYNPITREFMPKQGFPGKVLAPPEPWITLRHSHGKVTSDDPIRQLTAVLPTGFGGDFNVLRREVDRMPGAGTSVTVRRSSAIDIDVNGTLHQTTFKITRTGDNYSLSVTIRPPVQGVSSLGPFSGDLETAMRHYCYDARELVKGTNDFGLTKPADSAENYMSARADASSRVVRNATLSETERHDAQFVAQRMAQAESPGQPIRGERDPILSIDPISAEAHARVHAMGLVGQPDSLERLTRLLNASDSTFTPEMRAALARATLDATRAQMIRDRKLAPDDELLMLFRGVTGARTDDYEREGIDLARLGPGRDEDAGRGLYGSQDFQSALRYTGMDGQGAVLPLIVRRSELGNVVDVRSGTPLGDRWLEYVRANIREGRIVSTHPHLRGVLHPGVDLPFGLGRGGRGTRFANFLAELAADPSLPPAIREAARDPHITLMDLGGVASFGNDRAMLTDQFAMHHQKIADMFNEAHGFPLPRRGEPEEPLTLRTALTPLEGDEVKTTPSQKGEPKGEGEQAAKSKLPTATEPPPGVTPEFQDQALVAIEKQLKGLKLDKSDRKDVVAAIETVRALAQVDRDGVMAVLHAPAGTAQDALDTFEARLIVQGMHPDQARQVTNRLDLANATIGPRFRVETAHRAAGAGGHAPIKGLTPTMNRWLTESATLRFAYFADPVLFKQLHEQFVGGKYGAGSRNRVANFEIYVIKMTKRTAAPLHAQLMVADVDTAVTRMTRREHHLDPAKTVPEPSAAAKVPPEAIGPPVTDPAKVKAGMRVDLDGGGRGTVIDVENGIAHIQFDGEPTGTLQQVPIAEGGLHQSLEPNKLFSEPPPVDRSEAEMNARFDRLAQHRQDAGYPPYRESAPGTVAMVELNGETFHGISSRLDPANYSMPIDSRRALLGRLQEKHGLKAAHLGEAEFLSHAEGEALLRAFDRFGALPEVVEIYVDRATCDSCDPNLRLIAQMLGVKELRIYQMDATPHLLVLR